MGSSIAFSSAYQLFRLGSSAELVVMFMHGLQPCVGLLVVLWSVAFESHIMSLYTMVCCMLTDTVVGWVHLLITLTVFTDSLVDFAQIFSMSLKMKSLCKQYMMFRQESKPLHPLLWGFISLRKCYSGVWLPYSTVLRRCPPVGIYPTVCASTCKYKQMQSMCQCLIRNLCHTAATLLQQSAKYKLSEVQYRCKVDFPWTFTIVTVLLPTAKSFCLAL